MAEEERGYGAGSSLIAFFLGGLVGAGVALLLAPKSGSETRQMIKELAGDARERATGYVDKAKGTATSAVETAKQTATSYVEKGKEFIDDQKSVIISAVEAGKEAYNKEKEKLATERKA